MVILLYRQIRNVLIYRMTLFDSQESDLGQDRDYSLFPFRMPEDLVYR
jgi:hypothetical protein